MNKIEYQHQPNLALWSERMTGARLMLQAIVDNTRERGCQFKICYGEKVYHDAVIKLIMESKGNTEKFLLGADICFRNHTRNDKGKLISVEAYFDI